RGSRDPRQDQVLFRPFAFGRGRDGAGPAVRRSHLRTDGSARSGRILLAAASAQLQNKIKETFNLSDYYGMNWDAFNDIVDISVFKEVELKSFYEMYNIIPDDSLTFLEILIKQSGHSKHKCRITIK
ncbi:MAG: barstar family protein, partial [Oscillospiraceae bacterium]|nr:barstar family protein [Oscillospiraceae bacterium]